MSNVVSKTIKTETKTNESTVKVPDMSMFQTTSGKIRFLNSQGMSRGAIAKTLNIRYQHVRNVLITPVKTPK